jgi:hypothetical protein
VDLTLTYDYGDFPDKYLPAHAVLLLTRWKLWAFC